MSGTAYQQLVVQPLGILYICTARLARQASRSIIKMFDAAWCVTMRCGAEVNPPMQSLDATTGR